MEVGNVGARSLERRVPEGVRAQAAGEGQGEGQGDGQ